MDAGWFDRARQRFQEADEYPLIDDNEIVDRAAIWNYWPGGHGMNVRPDELFLAAFTSDHYELSVRFVWLNLFFRLAHYPAEKVLEVAYEQDEAPGHRWQFLEYLKSLVTLVDVDDCKDRRHIRWEIVNASAIQNWPRAKGLYDRLETLAAKADLAELWALRGRHDLLSVFAVPVASPEDLIVMKVLAGRPKDLEDVRSVLAERLTKLDVAYIRSMLGTLEQALGQSDLRPWLEGEIARAERLRP